MPELSVPPASIDDLQHLLAQQHYVADRGLATSVHLALQLHRPLLLEGEAGVGKTEVAKVLASGLRTNLIRLQCYEGLDVSHAVYEWNYARQLLEIRLMEASGSLERARATKELFSDEFLIKRPLLQALASNGAQPPVLLIDELDRADEEFEGFLLELLSDFQIMIPEIGTIRAERPPTVVITSNRTRELHDALKRRCLYYWIDYPDYDKELEIVMAKVPGAATRLAEQVTAFVQELRTTELYKTAGISETLDWVAALVALNRQELDRDTIEQTLGVILKNQEDLQATRGERVQELLNRANVSRPGRQTSDQAISSKTFSTSPGSSVRWVWMSRRRGRSTWCRRSNISRSDRGPTSTTRCAACWCIDRRRCRSSTRPFEFFGGDRPRIGRPEICVPWVNDTARVPPGSKLRLATLRVRMSRRAGGSPCTPTRSPRSPTVHERCCTPRTSHASPRRSWTRPSE